MKGKVLTLLAALFLTVGCEERYTQVPISGPTTIGKDRLHCIHQNRSSGRIRPRSLASTSTHHTSGANVQR